MDSTLKMKFRCNFCHTPYTSIRILAALHIQIISLNIACPCIILIVSAMKEIDQILNIHKPLIVIQIQKPLS